MNHNDPTHEQVQSYVAWLKTEARKGADTLEARAATADARKPKLTDAESAAIARAKIDRRTP